MGSSQGKAIVWALIIAVSFIAAWLLYKFGFSASYQASPTPEPGIHINY